MGSTNTISRSLHDVGLAAWFGGSLMGDIGLNGAASTAHTAADRNEIASNGWARWTPVNLVAIAGHLLGGAALLAANATRVAGQRGVGATTAAKTGLTAAALVATGYSRWLGQRQIEHPGAPVDAATTLSPATPDEVAKAQRRQRYAQWAIPVLTGALLLLDAYMGEQQRPASVATGVLSRVL